MFFCLPFKILEVAKVHFAFGRHIGTINIYNQISSCHKNFENAKLWNESV